MTREQITEGNKLIAEFMLLQPNSKKTFWYDKANNKGHNELHYHTSWDWLKPVVNEIFTYGFAHSERVKHFTKMSIVVDIEPCWESCVNFIKWHNENK